MELNIIQNKIYQVRGVRVMLDFDLAELYQVETKRLHAESLACHKSQPMVCQENDYWHSVQV